MNLPDYMLTLRPVIEADLQRVIEQHLPADYPELREMMSYHLGWSGEGSGPEAQGKRIRPMLVLLCAQAAGGSWQRALPAATAVELLHNFSLIHDDLQDNSRLRHGRPTVWVKWGHAQAINAGDIMFTLAFLALNDLANWLPAQEVLAAGQILQRTCLRLTEGQYLDISNESKLNLPMEAYWPMIGGKTSALLSSAAELGALAAGADETRRASFREYGYSLGLAFQVLDDWLGVWGDAAQTGKSVESDLVSGKKTLPVVYALAQEGAFAHRWMQGSIRPEEVPVLAKMLEEEGAYTYTLQTAEQLTQRAVNALNKAVCEAEPAAALGELTQALLKRKN